MTQTLGEYLAEKTTGQRVVYRDNGLVYVIEGIAQVRYIGYCFIGYAEKTGKRVEFDINRMERLKIKGGKPSQLALPFSNKLF